MADPFVCSLQVAGVAVTVQIHPNYEPDPHAEELAAAVAKLCVSHIARARAVGSCPGHEWEMEFAAAYLDGAADALCRCGARRSEVEKTTGEPLTR